MAVEREIEGPVLHANFDVEAPLLAQNSLTISGCALSPHGVDSVKVSIGGRELGASYGLPPPAWLQELPDWPGAAFPGFELALDTSSWRRGLHDFTIVLCDRSGGMARLDGVADVSPYGPPPYDDAARRETLAEGRPAMWCQTPSVYGGKMEEPPLLIGWAASAAGIATVELTIDGRRRLTVPHGIARPDLRTVLGEEMAAEAGFSIRLGLEELPAGWHELTVVAVDGEGRGVGQGGMVQRMPRSDDPLSPAADGARSGQDQELDNGGERFVPGLHLDRSLAPEHYARYRWAAGLVDAMEVLDAGCGVGWGTALIARRARAATGIDISPEAVAEANRRHGAVADFALGDLYRLPFARGRFDAVVSFETIEHVEEPERAILEMKRVLRPGGLLLVSSPNRGIYLEDNPFHLHELTAAELEGVLKRHFANVEIRRQQTHFASALLGDEAMDGCEREGELAVEAVKLVGHPPGGEVFTIAAASDGEIASDQAQLVLGSGTDYEDSTAVAETWQARVRRAEAEASSMSVEEHSMVRRQAAVLGELGERFGSDAKATADGLRRRCAELRSEIRELQDRNREILTSRSWRLTELLRRLRVYRVGHRP